MSDFVTPWTAARQASLSFIISQNLLKLMSVESLMLSNHLFLWCLLFLLPSIFPSIAVFPNESALGIRWPKCWSFSFSNNSSNEYSGLISFRIDSFDLLIVVQLLNSVRLFATPWSTARQAPLPFTSSRSLLRLLSIESVWFLCNVGDRPGLSFLGNQCWEQVTWLNHHCCPASVRLPLCAFS